MGSPPSARSHRRLPQLLAAHAAALGACRRCGHDDPAVLPIISDARSPRAMLVGQAPGRAERTDRRPFAGRAGKTMFRWLARAGFDEPTARAHIYIAAITRCYPGPSPSGRGDRVPSSRERALCSGWLEAELRLIRPAVLVPVGRLAIERFFGSVPLESVVGSSRVLRDTWGAALAIPLPHPSGASSWLHQGDHAMLLTRALALLGSALRDAGVPRGVSPATPPDERRSA